MQLLLLCMVALLTTSPCIDQFKYNHSPTEIPTLVNHIQNANLPKESLPVEERSQKTVSLKSGEPNISEKMMSFREQQLQHAKKAPDLPSIKTLKKCRPAAQRQRDQRHYKGADEQQFCYVSKQEYISREEIISSLEIGLKGEAQDSNQYVWIALLCAAILGVYFFYKMRVGLLLQVLAEVQLRADIKSTEYQQRLQELDELKKIYEIYWERVVYRNEGDVCYDHTVYEGRFLTQETYVYAVRLEHADVATLEHKLSKLLNCSHRRLAKLYYYTKTTEYMLIFTEKITPLSQKDLKENFSTKTSLIAKKNAIQDIIQTLSYLQEKIQLKLLPLESIQLDIVTSSQRSNLDHYDYKINTIPCLFRKMNYHCSDQDFDTASEQSPICLVRLNIVSLFHLILLEGRLFDKQDFSKLTKKSSYCNEQYIQFLDFILYEAKAIGHTHELLFREVLQHPFLWDSKRKILFLADFSNYIQTHLDEYRLARLEKHAKEYRIIKPNWIKEFHSIFASEVNFYRKYDFESIRDLIRMIRNKLNHFHEIPREVKSHIGRTPEGFIEYCFTIFPKLLPFAYIYTRKKKWKLHMK